MKIKSAVKGNAFNKRVKYFLSICILILLFGSFTHAQSELNFDKYSVKDGLSSSTVNSICQDRYGFLWLATENGLNRFDGYNFKVYKHDPSDSTSIPGDNLQYVIEDHEGNIWVAGYEVLAKFDRATNKFVRFKIQKYYTDPTTVLTIFEDSQNRKWITTDLFGVQLIDDSKKISQIVLKSNSVLSTDWGSTSSVIENQNGEVLVLDVRKPWQDIKLHFAGLFKFDERNFIFELTGANLGTYNNGVNNLIEDNFGNLWFTSNLDDRIWMFDPNTDKSIELSLSSEAVPFKTITEIYRDNDGYLWIGTPSGLIKYNPVLNESIYFINDKANPNSISSNTVASIFQDSFGQLWIGTLDGGLNKADLGKQPIHSYKLPGDKSKQLPIDAISAITTSPTDEAIIWIGTLGNGLYKYDRNTSKYEVYLYDKNNRKSISSNVVQSLAWDHTGNLFVATDSCLNKLNVNTKEITRYLENQKGLDEADYPYYELVPDKTGKLWLATNHGVDIFIPQTQSLKRLPNITNRKYDEQIINDMLKLVFDKQPLQKILRVGNLQNLTEEFELKSQTKLLAICLGEGRVGFDIENWGDYGWIEDESGKIVWGMKDVEKTFNLGGAYKNRTEIKTLNLEPGKYKLRYKSDQGYYYGAKSKSIRPPNDSLLWGIQVFEIDDNEYNKFDNLLKKEIVRNEAPFEIALSIEFSKIYENVLWIGTNNKGIFKYDLKTDTYKQFQPQPEDSNPINDILKIVEDDFGIVWFTTPAGLGRFDPSTSKFTFITEKDGLPANNVKAILLDNYRDIWVSSIVGLSEIIRESENNISSILNFTTQDGLQGFQFSFAAHKSKSGELFFGGNNGFNSFYPGRTNRISPIIAITDFNIASQSDHMDNLNSFSTIDLNTLDNLVLPYDENDFSIEFAAIHFAYPTRNKIYYKLNGVNSDWIKDNRRFASFTNLSPGDYTFELKASNGDGIWNENIKKISITILPPWYRTTLAYFMYAVLFIGFIYSGDRYQRRRLLFKEREKQKIKEALHRAEAAELQAKVVQAENERKSKELEEARELQLSMLPKELPQLPNLDIAVYMQTATEVGGDYYDFHVSLDGTLTVVLGDATGHGMKAGTMVTAAKSLFNSYSSNPDILYSFQEISRCIKQMQLGKLSMCMTMLKINQNKMIMSAAGMPPIMIYKSDERNASEEVIKGMPLGTFDNYPYDIRETNLKSGDTILLMSDGLPELQNSEGELFGYQRVRNSFENVAQKNPEEIIELLKNEGNNWSAENEADDDITFVVIKVK